MSDDALVLLVWGDNDFLVREAAREALGDVRPVEVEGDEWRPEVLADLATPSLFGEARALVVTSAQDLPDEAVPELARFAEDPPPDVRLVLSVVTHARAKAPPKRLVTAAGPRAEVRRAAVERRDLPGWIRERARRHGVPATPAGAAALVETVGQDPAVLDQAVAQIAAATPDEGLTPAAVGTQFRGFGDRRIWELCDAAFGGDLPGALRALTGMLEAREEPLAILGGIAARLRDLVRVRDLPPGMPASDMARAAGLRFDWQVRRYREQAARFSPARLSALHASLVEADGLLKQGGQGDVVLPVVVTRIAAGSSPGRAGGRAAVSGSRPER
ncbi:MAG: DNA polymerase III subunit delta [Actinomycetota bacterium]